MHEAVHKLRQAGAYGVVSRPIRGYQSSRLPAESHAARAQIRSNTFGLLPTPKHTKSLFSRDYEAVTSALASARSHRQPDRTLRHRQRQPHEVAAWHQLAADRQCYPVLWVGRLLVPLCLAAIVPPGLFGAETQNVVA